MYQHLDHKMQLVISVIPIAPLLCVNPLGHHEIQSERKRKVDDTWELTMEEAHKIKKIPAPSFYYREGYDAKYIYNFYPNYTNISVVLYHPVFSGFKSQSSEKQDHEADGYGESWESIVQNGRVIYY